MIVRARIALDNLDQVGALGVAQAVANVKGDREIK